MWWPTLAVVGFVVLMAVVVGLGMTSTSRYEREQRARTRAARPSAPPIGPRPWPLGSTTATTVPVAYGRHAPDPRRRTRR